MIEFQGDISPERQAMLESAVSNVIDRLPTFVMAIIAPIVEPHFIVYSDENDSQRGYFEFGEVHLNAHQCAESIPRAMWTIAHELAHKYLGQIGCWASMAVQEDPKLRTNQDLIDGLNMFGASGTGDKDNSDDIANMCERMADAVALSWGFGKEFVEVLKDEPEPPTDVLGTRPAYLRSDILLMAGMIRETNNAKEKV